MKWLPRVEGVQTLEFGCSLARRSRSRLAPLLFQCFHFGAEFGGEQVAGRGGGRRIGSGGGIGGGSGRVTRRWVRLDPAAFPFPVVKSPVDGGGAVIGDDGQLIHVVAELDEGAKQILFMIVPVPILGR